VHHLDYYEPSDLAKIIERSASLLSAKIDEEAAYLIGERSRFTPRIANRLLKRVRDFVQVTGNDTISLDVAKQALEHLAIDELGLDKNDRKFLEILIEKFGGGPVGLSTLSAATGEEVDTIADVYEPFLIRQGLIVRTPKGREATERGRGHLGKMSPPSL
jgi:Holliday junction DNA helicase RuvB